MFLNYCDVWDTSIFVFLQFLQAFNLFQVRGWLVKFFIMF